MAYQYDNYNKNQAVSGAALAIGDNTGLSPITTGKEPTGKSSVNLGTVGDIITGTVLQTGKDPIVEMNGTPIHVRSDVLNSVSKGDQIYLRITGNSSSEITLKMIPQEEMEVTSRNGAIQTEIMKNTAKFVENLRTSQSENNPNYQEFSKEATLLADSITDEEKQRLREMGIDISSSNLAVVKTLISQMRGQEQDIELQKNIDSVKKQILLQNPDLQKDRSITISLPDDSTALSSFENSEPSTAAPVTELTFDIGAFTEEINDLLPITEDQTQYLIQNKLPLTADNLYKSGHAGKQRPSNANLEPAAMEQLRPQMERAILTAGQEMNETTEQAAEFLLQKNLPLTSESLNTYLAIQDINTHGFSEHHIQQLSVDYLAEQAVTAENPIAGLSVQPANDTVTESSNAEDARTSAEQPDTIRLQNMNLYFPSAHQIADQMMQDLRSITEDSFFAFANTGMPYTLQNLSTYSASFTYSATYQITTEANTTSAITAHRQLEELRLKMTWEASYTLATDDIQIRAKELTEVVQALKDQEQNYLKQQFLADDLMPTKDQLHIIEDTNTKMKELPGLPASALATAYYSGSFTISRLHEQGMNEKSAFIRSTETSSISIAAKVSSYETLMTAPRRDMGDSIQKAFRNVDHILQDMNLPITEDNQRAVRILGYNQMELSDSNIAEIKAADQSVQTLIRNLQPSVVLHMVQDGINPLNMPIDELNELSRSYIQEQDLADDGKYSEFLQRLDSKGAISENDRKGYIGIYRLLDKITKSKGKDIGTVVRNGQSLTLQNLLTAHRSNRSTGIELSASETFGGLDVTRQDTSISDAILQSTFSNQQNNDSFARQTNTAAAATETGSAMSQTSIPQDNNSDTLTAQTSYEAQITEQLFHHITPELIDDITKEAAEGTTLEEFFDTIKEQITDELDPTHADSVMSGIQTDSMLTEESLASADLTSQTVTMDNYQFMQDMGIFPSMTNLYMTKEIRQANSRMYQELTESSSSTEEFVEHIEDHLTSAADMEQAYAELAEQKSTEILAKEEDGSITALDIQSLKMIRSGLKILQKMSRHSQFEIPFSVDGEWNVIHLSVIEGGDLRGHIQADIHTESYGIIRASLQWNGDTGWQGTYHADSAQGMSMLTNSRSTLEQGFEDIARNHPHDSADSNDIPDNSELYDISKQLVVMIKHIVRNAG